MLLLALSGCSVDWNAPESSGKASDGGASGVDGASPSGNDAAVPDVSHVRVQGGLHTVDQARTNSTGTLTLIDDGFEGNGMLCNGNGLCMLGGAFEP